MKIIIGIVVISFVFIRVYKAKIKGYNIYLKKAPNNKFGAPTLF